MSEWQRVKLGEVAIMIDYRGKTPKKLSYGIPLITAKIVKDGRINEPSEFISYEEHIERMTRGTPKKGDVVLTTEAPLGEVALLYDDNLAVGQRIITLRGNSNLDNSFLKYYLLSPAGQATLKARESGTTVTGIKQSELKQVEIPLPPLDEQKRIAQILSSLDDKMENNNAINKNLEEQAQTIFKSWFVDFEPFGGTMPSDWREGTLNNICMFNCNSYNAKEKWSFINYLDTSSITKNIISETQFLDTSTDKVPSRAKRKVKANDIVFSTVRPNQLHYGIIGTPLENMLVSTGFSVISAKTHISYHRVYLQLIMNETIEQLNSIAEQATSTFPAIKSDDIATLPTYLIPESLDKEFANLLEPIFAKFQQGNNENQKLSQLRDTLLPKLMSGELRV